MRVLVVLGLIFTLGLTGCSELGMDVDINKDVIESAVSSGVDTAKDRLSEGYEDLTEAKNKVSGIVSDIKASGGLTESTIQIAVEKALKGTGVEDNVRVKLTAKNYEITVTDNEGNTLVSMKLSKDSDLLTKEGRAEITRKIKDFVTDTYDKLLAD